MLGFAVGYVLSELLGWWGVAVALLPAVAVAVAMFRSYMR